MIIRIEPLPCTVRGFIARRAEPDGDFVTIILNANDPPDVQRQTLAHELRHYRAGHLDGELSLAAMEADAENSIKKAAGKSAVNNNVEHTF